MNKGCLISLAVFAGFVVFFAYGLFTAFGPDYEEVKIKQNIGGYLICNSVYIADHHSWQYDISYKYQTPQGQIIDVGNGSYQGREWEKDEQLIKYKGLLILKTGSEYDNDKVIIGNLNTSKWIEYKFSPKKIEADSLWKDSYHSLSLNFCCSEVLIDKIENGRILLHYKYRTSEKHVDQYGKKRIVYIINEITGQPKMTSVGE